MGRIEDTLRMRSQFAIGGAEFIDAEVWTKAFRLKHFGLCPRCDNELWVMRDYRDMCTEIECKCRFTAKIYDTALMTAEDTDDPIIDLVKKELGGSFVVVESGPTTEWSRKLVGIVLAAAAVGAAVAATVITYV